jgi:hypothetical protein
MTGLTTTIGTALAAGALALGGALGGDDGGGDGDVGQRASLGNGAQSSRTALVIDASRARDGRELVDPRLRDLDAEVRLPRTPDEARTNVRYFDSLGYRVVVTGPEASAAAVAVGVEAVRVTGLRQAVGAAED